MLRNNLLLLTGDHLLAAYYAGTASGIEFADGALQLARGAAEGMLETAALSLPAFTRLVASWNASTPAGCCVELAVQVRVDGTWSRWFSWGKWADAGANGGSVAHQEDELALLDVDVLQVRQGAADAVRFRLRLERCGASTPNVGDASAGSPAATPRVRLMACTFQRVTPASRPYVHEEIALSVPARAQLPVPVIGREICSPTSLAMVMQYYGCNEPTEQVAAGVKDAAAGIYGNRAYNVAYAGERGFTAWVERCDSLEDVKEYLKEGIPVIASVRTPKDKPLPGAVLPYPAGHLLVVTGFTEEGGQRFVLVNDPAAYSEADVPRRYPLARFLEAWRNIVYVVRPISAAPAAEDPRPTAPGA